jgi:hypothetical protein
MVAAAILADRKNRDRSFWMASSFVMPPLAIVLALLPRADEPPTKSPSSEEEREDDIEDILDADT